MKPIADTGVLELVDAIYEAAATFDLWPGTLKRIADAFEAEDAVLGAMATHALPWIFAPRTDDDYMRTYETYHPYDEVWHGIAARGVGAVATDAMVAPRETQARNVYYNEWSLPQGYRTKIGGVLLDDDGWRTVFLMPGREDFGPDALRLFRTLSPHMARAVRLNIRLAQGEADSLLSARRLQEMPTGALVVDADGRLLFANPAAEALFRAGLRLKDGVVTAHRPEEAAQLLRLIGGCLRGDLAAGPNEAMVSGPAGPPIILQATPLRRQLPLLAPGQPAAILFDATRRSPDTPARRLQARYGLTAAEAAFALEIAKGDGKPAAAARRGITFSTARTHLSRIFDKTGARRQAELVRLILAETLAQTKTDGEA